MKLRLVASLTLVAVLIGCSAAPTSCPAQTQAVADHHKEKLALTHTRLTPKRHFAMGYKADKGWTQGLKAFEWSKFRLAPISQTVDLTALMPPDDDQTNVGRCTGFGLAHALFAALRKNFTINDLFSPNFIYYNERANEGTVDQDSGAMIGSDGIFTLQKQGACFLATWPTSTDFTALPCPDAYAEGLKHLVVHAYKVDNQNGQDLERALSSGFVVVYGIQLTDEFENLGPNNYVYNGIGNVIGGHCMVMFAYNLTSTMTTTGIAPNMVRSRNQWGAANWGRQDEFDMPLSLAHSSAVDDCYVIDVVQQ